MSNFNTRLDWDLISRLKRNGFPLEELVRMAQDGRLDLPRKIESETSLHASPAVDDFSRDRLKEAIHDTLERYRRRRQSLVLWRNGNKDPMTGRRRLRLERRERSYYAQQLRKLEDLTVRELRRFGCKPACIRRKMKEVKGDLRIALMMKKESGEK